MSDDSRKGIGDLIRKAWAEDNPAGWFEPLYAKAISGEMKVPWAHHEPNPMLVEWLETHAINGEGKMALVIGCGLGDDAEILGERGFKVTAFDISESAIGWAKQRFPDSGVNYLVADLFNTPDSWREAYDFVLEIRTIQALPYTIVDQVMAQIAGFTAPGGTLLVICYAREPEESRDNIPWPLSRHELAGFGSLGLQEVRFEDLQNRPPRNFRVTYRKPG